MPAAARWRGFCQHLAGDKLDMATGGVNPRRSWTLPRRPSWRNGIDLAFRIPQSIDAALANGRPDAIVTMGCGEQCPAVPGAVHQDWDVPDPAGQPMEAMRHVRDEIESRVEQLITALTR
jgi:hypothetical protein